MCWVLRLKDTTQMQFNFYKAWRYSHASMTCTYVNSCAYCCFQIYRTPRCKQCRKLYTNPDTLWIWYIHSGSELIWIWALLQWAPLSTIMSFCGQRDFFFWGGERLVLTVGAIFDVTEASWYMMNISLFILYVSVNGMCQWMELLPYFIIES